MSKFPKRKDWLKSHKRKLFSVGRSRLQEISPGGFSWPPNSDPLELNLGYGILIDLLSHPEVCPAELLRAFANDPLEMDNPTQYIPASTSHWAYCRLL